MVFMLLLPLRLNSRQTVICLLKCIDRISANSCLKYSHLPMRVVLHPIIEIEAIVNKSTYLQ